MKDGKIAILVKKANLKFDKISNRMLAGYGLTHTQFKTLMFLYKNPPQTIRQIDIETYFSMSNPTVTGILQNLEKNGMVERVVNPADSRSKVAALTGKAEAMREELLALADRLENELTRELSKEEQEQLARLLEKMMDGKES
ncbi:MarR family winged helix-turn-helix transcriptional regulator [uncultured Clostridium sp.]|uniref:MarR family winged helix-turn-helix transcriptional regulator n=1 Tax=uncultured Clostridium sp. TaxID=59620 RepID=UPI0025D47053|nr:MarR family transcriptional regulator [uncultured Clostridium sp.]